MNEKIKIAIVDDRQDILSMLNHYFVQTNRFDVSIFSNPLVALESIDDTFETILLDVIMPQMDGLTLLEKLREKYPKIKVIIMTANSTLDRVLKAHKKGAIQYIMKPFSLNNLETKVCEVIAL